MVYVEHGYLVSGLYPSSSVQKNKSDKNNVSETGSVSVLRWIGQGRPIQLGPLERASLNHWTNLS
jgi:hypothetical protein